MRGNMRPDKQILPAVAIVCALIFASPAPATAQSDLLAGKSVQMIIGFGTGGGYDLWGRTVGRHIGRHLPGRPSVIPQNMPGAGSYVAASHIYNVAPKDGTVLGIIARDAALGPLSGATGARFDPVRERVVVHRLRRGRARARETPAHAHDAFQRATH